MKTTYSEERMMYILKDLHRRTINTQLLMKYGDYCKEHRITNALFPILVKHGILRSSKQRNENRKGNENG
jgi:hypothetical protein